MSTQDDKSNELLQNLGDPGTLRTAGERGEAREEDSDGDTAEDEETQQQRFRSSILLEDVLNKKDHKKFKDKLNLLSNLESH
jgi:hypothetical protein